MKIWVNFTKMVMMAISKHAGKYVELCCGINAINAVLNSSLLFIHDMKQLSLCPGMIAQLVNVWFIISFVKIWP